jgi:hypothetical protein
MPQPARGGGSLVAVAGDGWTDWLTVAGAGDGGPIDTDALVSACRIRNGDLVETHRIGGTRIAADVSSLTAFEPFARAASGETR